MLDRGRRLRWFVVLVGLVLLAAPFRGALLSVRGNPGASRAFPESNSNPTGGAAVHPTIGNPAAVHCRDLGYDYRIVGDNGQRGVCILPNEQVCDAWDFLQGKCGQSHSYCARRGYATRTVRDGRDPFSYDYAVCIESEGALIGSVTELSGLSEKATGCGGEATGGGMLPAVEEGDVYAPQAAGDPPASFDWRSYQGYDWLTPIKNQGGCGSCWAFAAVGVAESAHNIANGDPDLDKDLSEQYLVSDCSSSGSCCGGWHGSALTYIRDLGTPDEGCMPYVDGGGDGCSCDESSCDENCTYSTEEDCSDRTCSDRCGDWSNRLEVIASTGSVPSDPGTIKQALVDTGPLAVAMGIGTDYGGYWDGDIYRCTSDSGVNHAVAIVGYDDAGGYWWVRNSWGTGWAENGYFKLGYGECSVEEYVDYADAARECSDSHESNDTPGESTPLSYGATLNDPDICPAGDVDYYSFAGTAGDTVIVDIDARSLSPASALDSYLHLYGSDGVTELTHNDDYDGLDSYIAYPLPSDGTYYLMVRDYSHPNEGGPDYFYSISLDLGGLSVQVSNQSSQPAVDARVEIYSDTSQSPDFTGYTDDTGFIDFPDVPPGTYTVIATSGSDHFLLIEGDVAAPGDVALDTKGTAQVDVYTYGLDGTTPVGAGILFAPFFSTYPFVGWTDENGHLQVNVTPHTHSIIAASFGEPYFLVKPELTVGGAMQVEFDPPQMPTGEATFDLLDFPSVRIGSWGSHSAWSWSFELGDGQTMTFSPDTYGMGPDLMKSGSEADWYYSFEGGSGYASYEVVAGASETIEAGGAFTAVAMSERSFYAAGDSVQIASPFADAFANQITWVETYTPDAAGGAESDAEGMPPTQDRNGQAGDPLAIRAQAVGGWATICPRLVVEDANGQVIVDETNCAFWREGHEFALAADAVEGLYAVTGSADTGPHQGIIQRTAHFAVGWIFGDFDGDCQVGAPDVQGVAGRWRTSSIDRDPDGEPGTPNYDAFYDVHLDGVINVVDIVQVAARWGDSCP